MIRFKETTEKEEKTELLSQHEFSTVDGTKIEDAKSFWDDLFSISDEQSSFEVDEAALLSEIFGRYEDEFDFDFEFDDELKELLQSFEITSWERVPDAEKRLLIEELVCKISERLGLNETPEIRYFEGSDGLCGAYSHADNTIEINTKILVSPREVVDTVAHESRHAYQHQKAIKPESWIDYLYRVNFDNYISPICLADGKYLFFIDYQDQLVEAEARAFANLFHDKEAS